MPARPISTNLYILGPESCHQGTTEISGTEIQIVGGKLEYSGTSFSRTCGRITLKLERGRLVDVRLKELIHNFLYYRPRFVLERS